MSTKSTSDLGHDRGSTGSGSTTFTSGHEDHVCSTQNFFDLVLVIFGCLAANLWICTGTKSAGEVASDVELDVCIAH